MDTELFKKLMGRLGEFNEATKGMRLAEYAVKARPMQGRGELLKEAKERWEPGTGPWSKEPGELDQVDLVFLEDFAEGFQVMSCERGLMSGCITLLVAEVRNARGWPTPVTLPEPNFEYGPVG